MSWGEDEVHDVLSAELGRLSGNTKITVAEFTGNNVTIWRIYRDRNGTPQAARSPLDDWTKVVPDAFYRAFAPAFVVRAPGDLPSELAGLLPNGRHVPVYCDATPFEERLRLAIMDSPLRLGYELAVLKQLPDGHPDAGRLVLTGHPLFPPGARQGHQARLGVRCEPTNGDGTIFAVVTREPRRDVPPNARQLQPVQVESAALSPGTYDLTAVLARPGRVLLSGLPVKPGRAGKSWDDLRVLVPDRLIRPETVHLVCLIEVSGGEQPLKNRVDRLAQVIAQAKAGGGQLLVSVVSYGPHAVSWTLDEEPPAVQAWAADADEAEQKLRRLINRKENDREYERAAQLECALEAVLRLLDPKDGRPVLVTAGGRPPHPHAMDTRTRLIPCPDKVRWETQINQLSARGARLGSLRDPDARGPVWAELGRDAAATSDDAVDLDRFAADLGLHVAEQVVPFPFIS